MSKSKAWTPVLVGIAGAAAAGGLAYAFTRRSRSRVPAATPPQAPEAPALRESMVVPRNPVPDPLPVDLDLDGVFRGVDGVEEEPTVQADVKLPALASADDAEPPGPDELGEFWLTRATQSERSLREGDLGIDLEDIADPREELEEGEGEEEEFEQDQAPLAVGERQG